MNPVARASVLPPFSCVNAAKSGRQNGHCLTGATTETETEGMRCICSHDSLIRRTPSPWDKQAPLQIFYTQVVSIYTKDVQATP